MRAGRRTRAADLRQNVEKCPRLPMAFCLFVLVPAASAPGQQPDLRASQPVLSADLHCSADSNQIAAATNPAARETGFALLAGPLADAARCADLAGILDLSKVRSAALADWRNVLAGQQGMERTQLRAVQFLLQKGDARAAEIIARQALQILPKSPALYLLAAEAMQRQGDEYGARQLLVQGLSATGGDQILSRLASVQDAHGQGAAELYSKLADDPQSPADKQEAALERGFTVALRDGDAAQAKRLAARLKKEGHPEFEPLLNREEDTADETSIPGGREGLAFIAGLKSGVSAKKFLAEFARALLGNVCTGICFGVDGYKRALEDYFATVSQLESLGVRDHQRVTITISLQNPDERHRTERILDLLGVELHAENGVIRLVEGVKRRQARRQDVIAALAIDLIGMEKSLQSGKPYPVEIQDDAVAIYPHAELWKQAFPGRTDGGFTAMLLHSPQIARLYLSLSEIDPRTLEALFGAVSPGELATRFAEELARFGPAFAVTEHGAVVPGGPDAAPVWADLTGAPPDHPGPFFRAMLENEPMLAFFYAVSELDARHQAFFTANADRALRFFTLSKGLTAAGEYHKDLWTDTSFSRFMRSVPLDDNGHVIFPGSPGVWLVAKGTRADDKRISTLQKKASQVASAAVEDSILSRIAETQYGVAGLKSSELDNFLAVALLNAHLKEPMDDQAAILLAQHYAECWPLYVYFSDLPQVNHIGLPNYFSILDQIRQKPKLIQNVELGQLYALMGWVSILGRSEALLGSQAASLFSQIGEQMQAAAGRGSISPASLDLAKSIVTACAPNSDGTLDTGIRQCMIGHSDAVDERRAADFQRVLELQKAPSLEGLQSIAEAAQRILAGPDNAAADSFRADAQRMADAASQLPAVGLPRNRRVSFRDREAIEIYDSGAIKKYAADLKEIAACPHPTVKAARKIARELLNAIRPQITAALAAPIYAYYLRSTDLIVSEDPLLLRKHRYVDFIVPLGNNQIVSRPEFIASSEGAGSYFVGGFGDFALIAGRAAAPGFRQGGRGADTMIAAQLAAIRSVAWGRLTQDDQRLAALRILAAREWIVQAAADPEYFQALSTATVGVISLARRADLLQAVENRDWHSVWKSVPLPDLYMVGSRLSGYSLPHSDHSPVFSELNALEASGRGQNVNYLGRIPYVAYGCGHPHILPDAPYEEYARRLMQEDLAERTADFKLYLAYRADNLGVKPAELGQIAEKLAAQAFASSQLTDYHDWRSLFAAYDSISTNDLKKALEP